MLGTAHRGHRIRIIKNIFLQGTEKFALMLFGSFEDADDVRCHDPKLRLENLTRRAAKKKEIACEMGIVAR
jgi:hypothetical protein